MEAENMKERDETPVESRSSESALKLLLCGVFTPNDSDARLHDIAKQYHHECESYDLSVCGCIDEVTGVAIPENSCQMIDLNNHARRVLDRLVEENRGLSKRAIRTAISRYCR